MSKKYDFIDNQSNSRKSIEKWKEQAPNYAIDFIDSLLQERAITTCRAYAGDLRVFFNYLGEHMFKGTVPGDITIDQIRTVTGIHIIDFLNNQNTQISLYNRRLSTLKRFFHYLQSKGLVDTTPTLLLHKKQVPVNELRDTPVKVKNLEYQLNYLIEVLTENYNNSTPPKDGSVYKKLRDLVLVKLIIQTGLKINELVNLSLGDIDLKHGIIKAKRKSHYVWLPLEQSFISLLQVYLENRLLCTNTDTDALFLSSRFRKRLTYWGMNKIIKSYQINGIPHITSHDLRKSYAIEAYRSNTDIEFISDALGCQSIDMVKKLYL